MSSATVLSYNDRAVLGALFDPEASLSARETTINQSTEQLPKHTLAWQKTEQEAILLLNTERPSEQLIRDAIGKLTNIINHNPGYASAYANRAQAYRLLSDASSNTDILLSILADLETAIDKASPASPSAQVSEQNGRVLSQAYTHRGYLFFRAATSSQHWNELVSLKLPSLCGVTEPSQFEEMANRDFGIAGAYGSEIARQLAVKTNPYARLCGQIVKEALQREIATYYGHSGDAVAP